LIHNGKLPLPKQVLYQAELCPDCRRLGVLF
jgi:hypothetical protein